MCLVANGIREASPILHNLCKDDVIFALANTNDPGQGIAREVGAAGAPPHQWWSVMARLSAWYLNGGTHQGDGNRFCKWVEGATLDAVKRETDSGYMCVLGTTLTHSGHVVCVAGYTANSLILSDPYGDPHTGYTSAQGQKIILDPALLPKTRVAGGKHRILILHSDKRLPA